jgi:penicillin-binding protein 2
MGRDVDRVFRLVEVALQRGIECVLEHDASFAMVSRVEEHRDRLHGISRKLSLRRRYIPGPSVAHLVGYVAEVSEDELGDESPYTRGDLIGRAGLEKEYEEYLRGKNGLEFIEVDAHGRELGPLTERSAIPPVRGMDLRTSIDLGLQDLAWDLLGTEHAGAVAAIDPRRGDVLALVSRPTFDPNTLVGGVRRDLWVSLNSDSLFPLLNRPIQCTYPPGSVFKIAVAAAALEEGLIDPSLTKWTCTGAFRYGNRTHRCWKRTGHGVVDLRRAIVESCDVYFYHLGLVLGLERLHHWATAFGFGQKTGIDLAHEKDGLFPTKTWYDRAYGSRGWSKGVAVNLAIGQGEVLATPLQMAVFLGAIGHKGMMFKPRIGAEIRDSMGRKRAHLGEPKGRKFPLSDRTLEILQGALLGVTEDPHGTGNLALINGVTVAGKTGTAQNPHGEDHAWFVGYAPADAPVISVCAMVERGGHGGSEAAPIVKEIIESYLASRGLLPPRESTIPDDA